MNDAWDIFASFQKYNDWVTFGNGREVSSWLCALLCKDVAKLVAELNFFVTESATII